MLGAILFILMGCGVDKSDSLITVDVTVNYPKKELVLQDFMDVEYIPLETTAESLLDKDILNVTFAGDYLFVCDFVNLFQFTPEGKFIRKIGKAGEGPGEYAKSILAVTYDEDAKQIFISDFRKGKVLVYSFEGKYLYDINTQRGSMTTYRDKNRKSVWDNQ